MKSKIMAKDKAPMPKKSGMAGGTNTKTTGLAKPQQSAGNFATGPGVPTTPFRAVPPQKRGRGSSHDGPGAKATPHTTTFPPLKVGKAPNTRPTGTGAGKRA